MPDLMPLRSGQMCAFLTDITELAFLQFWRTARIMEGFADLYGSGRPDAGQDRLPVVGAGPLNAPSS